MRNNIGMAVFKIFILNVAMCVVTIYSTNTIYTNTIYSTNTVKEVSRYNNRYTQCIGRWNQRDAIAQRNSRERQRERVEECEDCAGPPRGASSQQGLHNSQLRLHPSRNCAPLSLCVCVVSEQYRLAKVLRCRECDLRLNWQGYNAVTTVYTRMHCCCTSTKECTPVM